MKRFLAIALIAAPFPPAAHAEERSWMLSGFDRIRVEGAYRVEVSEGSPGARADGAGPALDRISVRVVGRTLVVSPGVNATHGFGDAIAAPMVRVRALGLRGVAIVGGGSVTVTRLTGQVVDLSLAGSGSLDVADVAADRLNATLVGSGRIQVRGHAGIARFQSNGAGSIAAADLWANALTVNAQSAGDADFRARDTAEIFALGAGSVRVAGTPSCTVRGSGRVACGKATDD